MYNVYRKTCFSNKKKKNVYKLAKLFKEGQNNIQDEDRSGSSTMVSISKIGNSIMCSIADISEQLRISKGTEHKIMHDDLVFS